MGSPVKQYIGLGLYVVVESVILLPMLFLAETYAPGAIQTAGFLP